MSKQIANTILQQLGGNRFIVMTGAKSFIAHDDGLSFSIGRNSKSINYVKIAIELNDLYTITFEKRSISTKTAVLTRKVIEQIENVYFDQLQSIFQNVTGLYTRI